MGVWALAAVCYLPLLLTHRGNLGADTKAYLYLDPGRLMARSLYLWDPGVGLGTVTHQNIGYLFPMGPYYAVMELVGVPDWVAQRLWMGTIMFLAGLGVRYLLGVLAWEGAGATVASFAYALSPYLLHYIYKHSVILLPFSALPWLIAFTARALREGGWRAPALFALVALASGGINATSLLLVLVGPALWVLHAIVVEREISLRATLPPLGRIGFLTAVTSLWWIAGLSIQGRYGIDILRYTETYTTVANASSAAEVFRGLGYWFFYGTDALGPWFKAAVTLTQSLPAIAVSFAVPTAAVIAALLTRFRYRIFVVSLAIAGVVISVGAHPLDQPTLYGRLFFEFTTTSSGLAMRSTPRAMPLWSLAIAIFLGAGVAALTRWRPQRRRLFAAVALGTIVANLSPLWMGRMIDPFLERPGQVPRYWLEAGKRLDRGDPATRAWEVPGIEFANYRWGATVDPITPGLTNRDLWFRELVPWGSPPSADFTVATDAPFQDGSFDPASLVPIMRLAGVGDLVARNDLEYERYRTPRPAQMRAWLDAADIGPVESFGTPRANRATPANPLIDETEFSLSSYPADLAPVEIRRLEDPTPIVRAVPQEAPTILSGSGEGIVSLAESGLLDPERALLYSGSVSSDPAALDRLLDQGAHLVISDSNRRAAQRWGATRNTRGLTEGADEEPRDDPTDNRLDLFGRNDDPSTQTVVEQRGGLRVRASDYGNKLTYTPGDRAALAVDGDPTTAWKVGAFADVRGEWIELWSPRDTITTDRVRLLQAQRFVNRWITRVRLTFDGGKSVDVALTQRSRGGEGQTVRFGERSFRTLRIEILQTEPGRLTRYRGISGVGFAEIDLEGRTVREIVRPPTDLLDAVGSRAGDHRITYVFRRARSDPREPTLPLEEARLLREIALPTPRDVTITGKARINTSTSDDVVDEILGAGTEQRFVSSGRTTGDLAARASKAFDGDLATGWRSGLNPGPGAWIGVQMPAPRSLTFESMTIVDDAHHSVPLRAHLEVDGVPLPAFDIPPAKRVPALGTRRRVDVAPITVTGSSVRLVIDRIEDRTQPDWLTSRGVGMPLEVVEARFVDSDGNALRSMPLPTTLPDTCRSGLLHVADTDVAVRLNGEPEAAERGGLLTFGPCGGSEAIRVSAAPTLIESTDGRDSGIDIDQVVVDSPVIDAGVPSSQAPQLQVRRTSRVAYDLTATDARAPFWLILGQSYNSGWHLKVDGVDLGPPRLMQGYANGWWVDPARFDSDDGDLEMTLRWAPQRAVWVALGISLIGALGCLILLLPRFATTDPEQNRRRPMRAQGISPRDDFGSPATVRGATAATAAVAAGALVFGPWWSVPLVAGLTWWALRGRHGWRALRFVAVAAVALTAAYVLALQWRRGYAADFDWPQHFAPVASLPLVTMMLLGAEAVVEALRGGWRREVG